MVGHEAATTRESPVVPILLVLIAYVATMLLRLPELMGTAGAQSLEASYHVLWTARALLESPVSAHWLLPSVTLEPHPGNDIEWGATLPTAAGSYIYTSFPPLGFLVAALALGSTEISLDLSWLFVLNSLVGLVAACLAYRLVLAVFVTTSATAAHRSSLNPHLVGAAAAIVYLFTREALNSHGLAYWPHSISQLFLLASSLFLFFYYKSGGKTAYFVGFLIFVFLFMQTEWTGYVFAGGAAIAFLLFPVVPERGETVFGRAGLNRALIVGAVLVASLLLTIGHLIVVLNYSDVVTALSERSEARIIGKKRGIAGVLGLYFRISVGHLLSFGLLWIAGLAALFWTAWWWRWTPMAVKAVSFVLFFALIENLILVQHAWQFSFDRLQAGPALLVVCAAALAHAGSRPRWQHLTVAASLVIVSNLVMFHITRSHYDAWPTINAANQAIVSQYQAASANATCTILGLPTLVRGYTNLLFQSDIYEWVKPDRFRDLSKERPECLYGLIEAERVFVDLLEVRQITLFRNGETVQVIPAP